MSPCCLGMFSVVVYLILSRNSPILWICSTLDCIVSGQHRKTWSWFALLKGSPLLTVSPNVKDLPRSLKIEHVALITSSYPLT